MQRMKKLRISIKECMNSWWNNQIPICRGDKYFCHGFYDPWLFLCLQQVSIWCSWVQILLIEQWTVFENCVFQGFVGSDPFEEGMDWFCSGWFVNNLCLKQKTERIWYLVVGSSPFGRLFLTVYLKKTVQSIVRSFRLNEIAKMDLWNFEKKKARKNGRNLSKSPVFSCFLGRIFFDR